MQFMLHHLSRHYKMYDLIDAKGKWNGYFDLLSKKNIRFLNITSRFHERNTKVARTSFLVMWKLGSKLNKSRMFL